MASLLPCDVLAHDRVLVNSARHLEAIGLHGLQIALAWVPALLNLRIFNGYTGLRRRNLLPCAAVLGDDCGELGGECGLLVAGELSAELEPRLVAVAVLNEGNDGHGGGRCGNFGQWSRWRRHGRNGGAPVAGQGVFRQRNLLMPMRRTGVVRPCVVAGLPPVLTLWDADCIAVAQVREILLPRMHVLLERLLAFKEVTRPAELSEVPLWVLLVLVALQVGRGERLPADGAGALVRAARANERLLSQLCHIFKQSPSILLTIY